MKVLTNYLLSLALCFVVINSNAQNISIKGIITDTKTNNGLEAANIVLQTIDSIYVSGCISDSLGRFTLSKIAPDNYLLIVSYLGYGNSQIKLDNLTMSLDLGKIYLEETSSELREVVVQAKNVINKVDRQIILPRLNQLKASNSGYELLNNLMIAGLKVDPIQNLVSTLGGGAVQIRINNIKASATQVKSLRPSSVLRVEYFDDPGVRYANEGVSSILNFVVKQLESGVSIGIDLQNAPFTGFGNDGISFRANHGKSVFGFDYNLNYRDYRNRYSDGEEQYAFDGYRIERQLTGKGRRFGYNDHAFELSYNLTEPDKYVFNAILRDNLSTSPNNDFYYDVKYSVPSDKPSVSSDLQAYAKSNLPSLDLYYQRQLPNKQSITLNAVGTIIESDYKRSYSETEVLTANPSTVYAYETDGRKQSFIGEGLYDKEFNSLKWTTGLKYSQSYTENVYTGSTDATTKLHQSGLYAYMQIQGKLNKINYLVGVGVTRSEFSQAADGYTFYTIQPNLSLSHLLSESSTLRYQFSITPLLPSLSILSGVRQDLDDFRIRTGNSALQPYRRYRNRLVYQYQKKLFSSEISGVFNHYDNPIMESIRRDDGNNPLIIYTSENQPRFQSLGIVSSIRFGPFKDIVSVFFQGGANRYISKGNSYLHCFTNFYGGVGVQAFYKNWIFYTSVNSREQSLFGETVTISEASNNIGLFYTIRNCRIGLTMLYPYSKGYSEGSETLSDIAYTKSMTYIRENAQMLLLNFAWSVDYGKKHKAGSKRINNSDSDSGIMK
jgi:hypothetical protein